MLNRYLAGKEADKRGPRERRPYLATECSDLNEADKWRQQILREVGKKVMEIQNAGLGEHRWVAGGQATRHGRESAARRSARAARHAGTGRRPLRGGRSSACQSPPLPGLPPVTRRPDRIRDLNDEINKLIREKGHWEKRIVQLGGPDYAKSAPRITDSEGNVLDGAAGRGAGYRYFGAAKNLPGAVRGHREFGGLGGVGLGPWEREWA